MVFKVEIKDNEKSPLNYLPNLDNFENGKKYCFTPGVNIIVGENGCGKTTLMKLLQKYLLVDYNDCGKGAFNSNIGTLHRNFIDRTGFLGGVEVFADYERNTFRLSHAGEKENNQAINSFEDFGAMFDQKHASTGEGVLIAINSLFRYMFGKKANMTYDYKQYEKDYPEYWKYIKKHGIKGDEWTILMDEPDRNLSLENLQHIKDMLFYEHPQVQLIAVIHNPLLIYNFSKLDDINIIEMTEGYVEKVKKMVDELVK